MNGATEICDKNGKQTKIYQDSKQHGEKSVPQTARKMKNEIHLFQGTGGIVCSYQNLWNSVNSFIIFSGHSLYK